MSAVIVLLIVPICVCVRQCC